ncbi:2-hydroxyacid dehydrogenase [Sphingosinicella rhizophila]|uniref:D-glycerate dehydrogenase n=1 Tax=Sphingosinicella rhizophila TaxID=3050082 RepID=A0ABU3Q1X9_9SPHN|nr:D-glycerate dehydrogenase [Sphingosinicella sp. GR2756]MDT9597429.1 D-glycerate dehydrogenase [Sphingosinicella sp. GR2756]
MKERPARPSVIVTRRLPAAVEARMADLFDASFNKEDKPLTRAELSDAMSACDVFVPTVTDTIYAGLIRGAGERLRLIANFGAGTDHLDLAAARQKGIVVTNTPGVLTEDTADLVMALILAVPRRLAEGEKVLRAGQWAGWAPTGLEGHSVTGKKLGILGMGRIGRAVAKRARACGLKIHYHNRERLPANVERRLGAKYWPDLDAMLAAIDVLTINAPYSRETHHMIDARRLKLMKSDAYLINAARGSIVDQEALIGALQTGTIAGAGLDVFPDEPNVDPRLLRLSNVVLLPHMGSATFEGRVGMGNKVIANIRAWVDGHRPPDQVLEGWA